MLDTFELPHLRNGRHYPIGLSVVSLTNVVNEFGALTTGADTTIQVQNALSSNPTVGLYFPAGVFMVQPGLLGASNILLQGAGVGRTIIRLIGNSTADMLAFSGKTGFSIRDITFDWNSKTATGNIGILSIGTSTDWSVAKCRFINLDKFGVIISGSQRWSLRRSYISRAATVNTANQAILLTSAAGANIDGDIERVHCKNSAMDISGSHIGISRCRIQDFAYGGGITTEQDANTFANIIDRNVITGGIGTDINATVCMGIENWGGSSTISLNIIHDNGGNGIDQGGQNCSVTGNIIYDNGKTVASHGIVGRYFSATYNAKGSTYAGNTAFDTGAGTQLYGFAYQSVNVTYQNLGVNNFNFNAIGPILLSTGILNSQVGPTMFFSLVYDPPNLIAGATADTDIVASGAVLGDAVSISFSRDMQGIKLFAYVSVANNIHVRLENGTAGAIDLASGTLRATLIKQADAVKY